MSQKSGMVTSRERESIAIIRDTWRALFLDISRGYYYIMINNVIIYIATYKTLILMGILQ